MSDVLHRGHLCFSHSTGMPSLTHASQARDIPHFANEHWVAMYALSVARAGAAQHVGLCVSQKNSFFNAANCSFFVANSSTRLNKNSSHVGSEQNTPVPSSSSPSLEPHAPASSPTSCCGSVAIGASAGSSRWTLSCPCTCSAAAADDATPALASCTIRRRLGELWLSILADARGWAVVAGRCAVSRSTHIEYNLQIRNAIRCVRIPILFNYNHVLIVGIEAR